ncbi:MAG: 50S ribosomal protein L10 [Candidatus Thorarchaeota archaeon]|nr:50S ribosomal protein L10 [Candidatus Thorarchaeota archaeon]
MLALRGDRMSVYEKSIPQWKVDLVEKLSTRIKDSAMVGLVNVEGVGAKQLSGIRESLRYSAEIKMARNTLMIRALEASKVKGIDSLIEHVKGPVAFVFSDQDPFILSKFLRENKTPAPAKGGQTAPNDIMVPAMNTGVAPGPFISELAALRIPSRVKSGVIHITDDTVVVKAGNVISNAMAMMLTRLGIEPMELQLKLIAAYTDGAVLTAESFDIDLQSLFQSVILGHQYAMNLSINSGYPTSDTMPMIIVKADREARSLALSLDFFTQDLLGDFLAKASSEAFALAAAISEKDPEAIPSEVLDQVRSGVTDTSAATSAEQTYKKPEEPGEDEEEEESVAGLSGLFG